MPFEEHYDKLRKLNSKDERLQNSICFFSLKRICKRFHSFVKEKARKYTFQINQASK